jgi:hypothetical protein
VIEVFKLQSATVKCEGEEASVKKFSEAFKKSESGAVSKVHDYIKNLKGNIAYNKGNVIVEVSGDDIELPKCFEGLLKEFPDIVFIFEMYFLGTNGGCLGYGNYFSVYEKGKRVYDTNNWLEQLGFLNLWLVERGLEGDFYDMLEEKERKEAIAKARLVETGKEATEDEVKKYIDNYFDDSSVDGGSITVKGRTFFEWSKVLNITDYEYGLYDLHYGYDDYLLRKELGLLPSFNAKAMWYEVFDIGEKMEERGNEDGYKEGQEITSEEIALAAVKNYVSLNDIPEAYRTENVCLTAIRNNSYEHIVFVPEKYKTERVCYSAVRNTGTALEYVPEKHKTYELCLFAVGNESQDIYQIQFVPEKHKTLELCVLAAQEAIHNEYWSDKEEMQETFLKYIPKNLQSAIREVFKGRSLETIKNVEKLNKL